MGAVERKKILHRIADRIVERAEEIALCECWDTGQALRFMSKAALRGAENFRFFADKAPGARDGQSLPSPTLMAGGILTLDTALQRTCLDLGATFVATAIDVTLFAKAIRKSATDAKALRTS